MSEMQDEKNYMSHLVELRKRSIYCLVAFIIFLFIGFNFVPQIITFIKLTSGTLGIELNIFNITDSLYMYLSVASLCAFTLTFPVILLQFWLFIRPALTKSESRFFLQYVPLVILLFLAGIIFAYIVIIPYYVMFSGKLADDNNLKTVIGAKEYIDFIVKLVLPFGIVFELPMLIHILSKIGLINYGFLKVIRPYAYIGLMILAAFITPPDPISMGIVLIPLALLYETSIQIAKRNNKKALNKASSKEDEGNE